MSTGNDSTPPPSTRPRAKTTTSFAYEAQTAGGESVTGTIDARDLDEARGRLVGLGLRIASVTPTETATPKPLRGDDFLAFNQQLGQLASAGLPLEQGLRLIAQDMRTGRLSRTVNLVAEELERGVPLGEAFARHQANFPPLYGSLMDAGVRSGNLPAMLLNLSRYSELTQRLRATLWRAIAYPLTVMVGLVLVLMFLSTFVLPKFELIFQDFRMSLPAVTRFVLAVGHAMPWIMAGAGAIVVLWLVLVPIFRRGGSSVLESIALSIPLVGPVVRRGLLARWCDAVKLSVDAGLDLPAAFDLAARAIGSNRLRQDGDVLLEWLHQARAANVPPVGLRLLPHTVAATIALAVRENQLSRSLGTLVQMYAQQVEQRTYAIPAVLGPALLLCVTVVIGVVILGVLAPLILLLRVLSGPS